MSFTKSSFDLNFSGGPTGKMFKVNSSTYCSSSDAGVVLVDIYAGPRFTQPTNELTFTGCDSVTRITSGPQTGSTVSGTTVSFGFNSALSFTIDMLDRFRQAAQSARKIGVVEVLGEQAGWLALQAGIAVGADVVQVFDSWSGLLAPADFKIFSQPHFSI